MNDLRTYILSVVACAIVCSIVTSAVPGKGTLGAAVKLVCGILLVCTAARPLPAFALSEHTQRLAGFLADGSGYTENGRTYARTAMEERITQQAQTYILDKAQSLGLDLNVQVILSDGDIPAPCAVYIRGNASPAARVILQDYIADNIGIPKEEQMWTA